MALYSFLLMVFLVLAAPYWLVRMTVSGRYRAGLADRLGLVPHSLRAELAELRRERRAGGGLRPLIWIHAVSVGEVLAAARLIDEFRQGEFQRVRPGLVFAVTTTTEAGNRLARERLTGCAVFYFPLDFAFAVRRYLRLLTPEMVILIESELWPRLITECAAAGVPIAVANARISDRSFPRYMRLRALWRPILAKVGVFLAQSEETVERLRAIGATRVELTGNLKYDARPARETPLIAALRSRLEREAEVVVCGSTLEGEEAMLLDAWDSVLMAVPRAVLVIAPRHPARFDEVALLVKQRGRPIMRASNFARVKTAVAAGSVFLLDTIGDLASAYSLAEVAFIGGSLVHAGGHNPMEPARFGVPVVMGASFENFREMVETMRAAGGIRIVGKEELSKVLVSLLRNRDEGARHGRTRQRRVRGAGGSSCPHRLRAGSAPPVVAGTAPGPERDGTPLTLRRLLRPLVPVYAGVISAKAWLLERGVIHPRHLRHPVISVGSLSAGGAGKTPMVILLAELLSQRGYEIRILTRGYGRRSRIVQRVDAAGSASQFGDEPMMMARRLAHTATRASVWVGADRHRAGTKSEEGDKPGTKVVYLLDDGFQHRKLARDVDIVLLTRRELEDSLLPEGNLREPLHAMRRADVIVLREEDGFAGGISGKAATWFIRRELHFAEGEAQPSRPVAFCGLARPEGFFAMLSAAGVSVAATQPFRDHHGYCARDLEGLLRLAEECGADGFVTTEKDAVKLTPTMMERLSSVGTIVVAELSVELVDEQPAVAAILERILDAEPAAE